MHIVFYINEKAQAFLIKDYNQVKSIHFMNVR